MPNLENEGMKKPSSIDFVIAVRRAIRDTPGKSRADLARFMKRNEPFVSRVLGPEDLSDEDAARNAQELKLKQKEQIESYLEGILENYLPSLDERSAQEGTLLALSHRTQQHRANAMVAGKIDLTDNVIPLYGSAEAGPHGEFPLNGNISTYVPRIPALNNVQDAYAVYVIGDSMEDRYFAGEYVYVNPRQPVKKGDFVVAQILPPDMKEEDGRPPLAFLKRFVSRDAKTLKLEQLNPREILSFPAARVVSVHRIVGSGSE